MDEAVEFTEAVLSVVDGIPAGRVMTYGDVAAVLGSAGARAVGRVLRFSGLSTVWWRVVRAGGWPPRGREAAALEHYEREGTPLVPAPTAAGGYRVDLRRASAGSAAATG